MFISCFDKRKNFYLLKKYIYIYMDCILFIFQKIFESKIVYRRKNDDGNFERNMYCIFFET